MTKENVFNLPQKSSIGESFNVQAEKGKSWKIKQNPHQTIRVTGIFSDAFIEMLNGKVIRSLLTDSVYRILKSTNGEKNIYSPSDASAKNWEITDYIDNLEILGCWEIIE